jgi:hypothetical protein
MSPASRAPRGKQSKKSRRRTDLTVVRSIPGECDCPACSGADVDPEQMISDLLEGAASLAECEDPLDAELAGAAFVSMASSGGDDFETVFVQEFIPQVEARPGPAALAVLTAIGAVGEGQVAKAATRAADRLAAAGIAKPRWAGELAEPVAAGTCWRLHDTQDTMSVLVGSFHRAARGHAVVITVEHQCCGAAADITFLDSDDVTAVLDDIRAGARSDGLKIKTDVLDAAEFRWYVEHALDARAEHDAEAPDAEDPELFDEEESPGYPVLAVLVRARVAALPEARQPSGTSLYNDEAEADLAGQLLAQLMGTTGRLAGGGFDRMLAGRVAEAKMPAKRKKSDGPAPIYQIKVGLSGAKPPIWRRLLVPADVSLARLHGIIQVAFGWEDSHLHVFQTPYGDFGRADRELGHRAEAQVALEQVAPAVKDKIRYTYDFGDNWVHEIVVEKVLNRDGSVPYPRCAGGRRAAPPDDCGGIWGYEELMEVLGDPDHPEHAERLEWMSLDDASKFAPDAFDADAVNRALGAMR